MIDQNVHKTIQARYATLPESLKDLLQSGIVEKKVAEIASYYKLDAKRIELENEVLLVLLLCEPIGSLKTNVKTQLAVTDDIAEAIASEIELLILYGVTDLLRGIEKEEGLRTSRVSEMQAAPPIKPGASLPTAQTPNLKERLHLRPEGVPNQPGTKEESMAKPLTREELMGSLLAKRTMASDIAAVKGAVSPPNQQVQPATPENKEPSPQNPNNPQK